LRKYSSSYIEIQCAIPIKFSMYSAIVTSLKAQRTLNFRKFCSSIFQSISSESVQSRNVNQHGSSILHEFREKYTLPLYDNSINYRHSFPDFLPDPDFKRRNTLREKLERIDMLRRRQVLNIPEFYVGSILAVTLSVPYTKDRTNRFVGICIQRDFRGLRHFFTLRNVIDNEGFEIRYNLYNPTVRKIEVLKLEKRLDDELFYLRDALPEYSTIPFDMEAEPRPVGAVPLNKTKVKLKPPPWTKRWELCNFKGIEDFWHLVTPYYKLRYRRADMEPWRKYDIVDHYRKEIPAEDQQLILDHVHDFEKQCQLNNPEMKTRSMLHSLKARLAKQHS
ncbi:39S ribosomal protein L19, mitochondrial, partial [Trichinella pseudospiralis]